MNPRNSWRRAWPIGLLLVSAAWLHRGELLGQRFVFRDTSRLYAPAKFYLARLLHAGVLPQWWPWDGAGAPMLAQPIFSTFHPTTLLYVLLPFWKAFAAQDLAGTLLALSGTYLVARSLRLPRSAATIAAVFFAANGYVMGLTEHQFMKLAAGTLPWYAWALLEARRRGGPWLVAPVAVMGLLLLAGDPQIAILAAAGGAVLLLAQRCSWRTALLAFLAPLLGATLAAIQLWPSLLLAPETERALPLISQDKGAFDLAHAAGLVIPLQASGFAPDVVVGLAGLALVGASLIGVRRSRTVAVLWALLLLSVWLSAGSRLGLNTLAQEIVPLWGKFRYPIKSLVLGMLAAALLAGEGLRQLLNRRRNRRAALFGAGFALSMLLTTLLFFRAQAISLAPVRLSLLASALPAFIVLGATRWRLRLTTITLASAQLLWFGGHVLPTVAPSFYARTAIAQILRTRGVGLTGPAFERISGSQSQDDSAHIAAVGGGGNSAYGAFAQLPTISYYTPGASRRLQETLRGQLNLAELARLLGIFGVGYFVESPEVVRANGIVAADAGQPLPVTDQFGDEVMPLRRSLARSYVVHRARPVTPADVHSVLLTTFKPGREVLLEGAVKPEWSARPDHPSIPARIVSRTNTRVTIDANAPWPGFLVLNESYYPGWTATVDGHPTVVRVANGFVRAVELPPGPHRVSFHYRTPGLAAGALVSLLAWLGLGLAWWRLRRAPA